MAADSFQRHALQISGHPVIAPSLEKFYGIRNGIDQEIWDPLFDKALPKSAFCLLKPLPPFWLVGVIVLDKSCRPALCTLGGGTHHTAVERRNLEHYYWKYFRRAFITRSHIGSRICEMDKPL